jgi:predicted nucleotidyltransferase
MQIPDACISWLRNTLAIEIVVEAWIFGSATRPGDGYNDVDVFVRYRDGSAGQIIHLRRCIEVNFKDHFGLPLHLLTLSDIESEQSSQFLEKALGDGVRIV